MFNDEQRADGEENINHQLENFSPGHILAMQTIHQLMINSWLMF